MSDAPYRVGVETTSQGMLLAFADMHGIRDRVYPLLEETGNMLPAGEPVTAAALLQYYRRVHGLTKTDIHERCKIAISQINAYERGEFKNPGLRTIQALSYGYRLPFPKLLVAVMREIRPRSNPRQRRKAKT